MNHTLFCRIKVVWREMRSVTRHLPIYSSPSSMDVITATQNTPSTAPVSTLTRSLEVITWTLTMCCHVVCALVGVSVDIPFLHGVHELRDVTLRRFCLTPWVLSQDH